VIALCLAAMILEPSPADFFPLVPGSKYVYQESGSRSEDIVGEPIDINGTMAYPVKTMIGKQVVSETYYAVDAQAARIVAFNPKKPLPSPQPVFQISPRNWTWEGSTYWLGEPAPVVIKGSSSLKGKKKVLDQDVEILEVKSDARIGGDKGPAILVTQVVTYAKGIGMVEMKIESKIAKRTTTSKLSLVSYQVGASGLP